MRMYPLQRMMSRIRAGECDVAVIWESGHTGRAGRQRGDHRVLGYAETFSSYSYNLLS